MDQWTIFWGALLVVVILIFAGVAVKVTIGGFFDVKEMFKGINEQHEEDENEISKDEP